MMRRTIKAFIKDASTGEKFQFSLRCAVCEIKYMDDIPAAAAINEAVEMAKGYDEPETVAFINGVLGGFMRGEFPEEPVEALSAEAETVQ